MTARMGKGRSREAQTGVTGRGRCQKSEILAGGRAAEINFLLKQRQAKNTLWRGGFESEQRGGHMGPARDLLLGMHEPSSIQELSFPSEPLLARLTATSAFSPWPHCAAQCGFDLLLASKIRDAVDVRKKAESKEKKEKMKTAAPASHQIPVSMAPGS